MWPFPKSRRALERSVGRAILSKVETRVSPEDPRYSLSNPQVLAVLFGDSWTSAAGIDVTVNKALGVPALWCAVNFIAGTFAALPAPVYRRTGEGREKAENDSIYWLLHDWVNDDYLTSFAWRKLSMMNTLVHGRSYTFIEGKKRGRITNLWPLEPTRVTVRRVDGRRQYVYDTGNAQTFTYDVDEIIDIPFLMTSDNLSSYDPVGTLKNSIGLCIALEEYASKFFQNGGVPPLAMQMPAGASPGAGKRASINIEELLQTVNDEKRLVLPMPEGHRLDPIAFDPLKGQLTEARKHQLREIARIYGLPPVFLQDLEFGTYSNTEQQDLILVKHTLTQWLRCWEQELNAKLFGPRSKNYIEFSVDGLLRGDFKTRMEGYASAIQNALMTPNQAADLENRPRSTQSDADMLHIQGATVPLGQQTKTNGARPTMPTPAKTEGQDQ